MKEIKFRAWDKENKEIYNDFHQTYMFTDSINDDNDYILMQYTGLKDKNGKEIYEGDIVRYKNDFAMLGEPKKTDYTVEFKQGQFYPFITREQTDSIGYWRMMGEDVEVIGNIYEDKELLI
jgi:uncharacterized phage protein (TIGR01671 family)